MNTRRLTLALMFGWTLAGHSTAHAQIGQYMRPQVNPRPTVSPYLSIFRGQNAAINYFGIVRPQLEMGRQMQALQSEVTQMQAAPPVPTVPADQQAALGMPMTGHPSVFFNTSHYFPGPGGRSSSGRSSRGTAGGLGNPTGMGNPSAALTRALLLRD